MTTATRRRRSAKPTVAKTDDLSQIPTGYQEEYDDRPPAAGVHPVTITEILGFEVNFSKKTKKYYNNSQVHLRITPDAEDESSAGRALMFVKLGHYDIRNALKYAFSADDIASNAQGVKTALQEYQEDETVFYVRVEWKARDSQRQNEMLLKLTEVDDIDKAFKLATQDQWAAVNKEVVLATKMTDFPEDGRGGYIPTIATKDGREVPARAFVTAVIQPAR